MGCNGWANDDVRQAAANRCPSGGKSLIQSPNSLPYSSIGSHTAVIFYLFVRVTEPEWPRSAVQINGPPTQVEIVNFRRFPSHFGSIIEPKDNNYAGRCC